MWEKIYILAAPHILLEAEKRLLNNVNQNSDQDSGNSIQVHHWRLEGNRERHSSLPEVSNRQEWKDGTHRALWKATEMTAMSCVFWIFISMGLLA